jgi:hypothetical protein
MTIYVTKADVDSLLGIGWEGTGDADRAVLEANTYLSSYTFKDWDTQPDEITRAGAELAKIAAQGELYADSQAGIKRKRVRADTVETETEYADGGGSVSGALSFVHALIRPWVINTGAVKILKRL